ncbi:MAG: 2Fe-2S iron-sulfur cluster-binding protein [Pseudomonadota bacterium]
MASAFHSLEIKDVRHETDDAVAIAFNLPENNGADFSYIPGQFLTLKTEIDGEEVRRSYSICSAPGEPLKVGVKKVEGGAFSTFAQTLKPGDRLDVMPPDGRFTLDAEPLNARHILLIGAGSGITPLLSIASWLLEKEPHSSVTLVYGNRETRTIMFREALEDLKDRYLERFEVFHILSREPQDVALFNGRITGALIGDMTESGLIAPGLSDQVFLCGPAEMTETVRDHLTGTNVPEAKIHVELFTPADGAQPKPRSEAAVAAAKRGVAVDVILDGLKKSFVIDDPEDTVLAAATKAGLDLPFSCAGGMCATCRCKVVEGAAEMDINYSLADWEQEQGYILSCQAHPVSEKIVLDFDAV